MKPKVLLLHATSDTAATLQREFGDRFEICAEELANTARERIASREKFSAVVANYHIPGTNGLEFLETARELQPTTSRVLITNFSDATHAVRALNQGLLFRFLTRPLNMEAVGQCLIDSMQQHRLIQGERDIIERTVLGSVGILTDMMSLVDPLGFSRTPRLKRLVALLAKETDPDDMLDLQLAAVLCTIGVVTIPQTILMKIRLNESLSEIDERVLAGVPEASEQLVAKIPRLERVAKIIRYQAKNFDGSGKPNDKISSEDIPLASRILHVALAATDLEDRGYKAGEVLEEMKQQASRYDPRVLQSFEKILLEESRALTRQIEVEKIPRAKLQAGQVMTEGVENVDGLVLIPPGTVVTDTVLRLLDNHSLYRPLREPLSIERKKSGGH